MSEQLKCPKCGQIDMVQKVSALYGSGISVGEYSGPSVGVATPVGSGGPTLVTGSSRLSGVSQTALSAKLAPPTKPTYKAPGGWLLTGCLVVILGPAMLSLYLVITGDPEASMAIIEIPVFLGIAGGLLWWRKWEGSKRRKKFEQEMAVWKKAIGKWNQLYYCARDDGVFIPGRTQLIPVYQMKGVLYQE